MRMLTRFHLFLMLTVLVSAVGILVPAADAQTIHYLQIIDNGNPVTAVRAMIDMIGMEAFIGNDVQTMITKKIPSAKIEKSELFFNDLQATRDNILNWIKNLQPVADDVVFVYFSGYGGADKTETKDMYLTIQEKERLYRKEIVEALEGLDCRLKIFITNANGVGPQVSPPGPSDEDVPLDEKAPAGELVSLDTALYNLFFEHEGFLNLSSASEGEMAFGENLYGSYFTYSFVEAIIEGTKSKKLDVGPQDGYVSWKEVLELAKEMTQEMVEKNIEGFPDTVKARMTNSGQTTQTPKYFGELPKRFER